MKKKAKSFIWLSVAAFAILLTSSININYMVEANKYEPKAYNYKPSNILDNVFIQNNQYILPFIFTDADQTVSKSTIISEFNRKGLTITNSINKDIVGTGTQIKANNGKTYTVLVYGDVNGDGKINLIDAQKIVMHHKGISKLSGIYFTAGNVANNNEVINLIDAQRVVMLKKRLTNKLVINEPASLKELDKVAPVITLKGQKNITITIGDNYIEPGATAVDNYDGNVNVSISGTVNTQKAGTYTITYTAVDSVGNKATTTRTVQVVDGIKSIEMATEPTVKKYEYEQAINLNISNLNINGANILVKMKSGTNYTKKVESSMIFTNDVLSTPGTKTITVTYQGKTTSFVIQILKPISTLQVNENDRENISIENSKNYAKVNSNFTLGSIYVNTGSDVTPLKIEQLKAEVNSQDLEVRFVSQNGKILVQCSTNKVGEYQITPYIEYGNEKVKAQTIEVKVKSKVLKLDSVKLNTDELKIYLELPTQANNVKTESDNNIYTILPITFLDQDGDEIEVTANKITVNQSVEEEKVNITLPLVKKDQVSTETNANAIKVKLYNSNNEEAQDEEAVCKIGFAINQNTEIDLNDVTTHSVEITGGNTNIILPIKLQLKALKKLIVTLNPSLQLDTDKYYNILELNQEVILGQITSNKDEETIKLEDLTADVVQNGENGIEVTYKDLGNGVFEIRAKILKEGLYQITPKANNVEGKNIFVKCSLTIKDVSVGENSLQMQQGEEKILALTVKSNMHPDGGQEIRLKDIKAYSDGELDIKFLDSNQVEIADENTVVSYIKIIVDADAPTGDGIQIIMNILDGKYKKVIPVEIIN